MPRTSTKKHEIYDYLTSFIAEHGYSPSIREIGEAVGLKSTATVHYHLTAMQREGLIAFPEFKKRVITVPGEKPRQIPILGTVTAGVRLKTSPAIFPGRAAKTVLRCVSRVIP